MYAFVKELVPIRRRGGRGGQDRQERRDHSDHLGNSHWLPQSAGDKPPKRRWTGIDRGLGTPRYTWLGACRLPSSRCIVRSPEARFSQALSGGPPSREQACEVPACDSQDAEASFSGQLVKKEGQLRCVGRVGTCGNASECFEVEGGSFCSYKDSMALGQLREVLLAGFEPKKAPNQGEKFLFEADPRVLKPSDIPHLAA